MNELAGYLSLFEASPTSTPSQSGLSRMSVSVLQTVLHKLGVPKTKANSDGLYGPTTKRQWEAEAQKRKLNPAFDRAAKDQVWVAMPTYTALSAAAYGSAATTAAQPKAPAVQKASINTIGLIGQTVLRTQELLQQLGSSVKADGLYGPSTAKTWATAAKKRGVPDAYVRVDGKNVAVAPATLTKFETEINTRSAARAQKPTTKVAPAAPKQPSTVGMKNIPVAQAQQLLHALGLAKTKATSDGLYGATTAKAWAAEASKRKLSTAFVRIDGSHVAVDPQTLIGLQTAASLTLAAKAEASKSKSTKVETVTLTTLQAQKILHDLGFKKTKANSDGLYGPTTTSQWAQAAKQRGLNPSMSKATSDGKKVYVAAATARGLAAGAALALDTAAKKKAAAPKTPTPAPTKAPVTSKAPTVATVGKSVKELQDIVHRYGVPKTKATSDGLYGSTTAKAWSEVASARNLSPYIARVSGTKANVAKATYDALAPSAPKPEPKESIPTVVRTVKELQGIMHAHGLAKTKSTTDGLFGPTSAKAWSDLATSRKLPPLFARVSGTQARVADVTYQTLIKAKPVPVVVPPAGPSTATLTVKTLQQGLNNYLGTKTLALPLLDTDNIWGASTQKALVAWLATRPGGKEAKVSFNKDKGKVTLPIAFAQTLSEAAKTAPAPPSRVSLPLTTAKKGLVAAGLSGSFSSAMNAFMTKVDFAPTAYKLSKDGKTVERLRKNIADKLTELASGKSTTAAPPEATSKTTTPTTAPTATAPTTTTTPTATVDPIEASANRLVPQFTTIVSVLDVQKYLSAVDSSKTGLKQWEEVSKLFPQAGVWGDKTAQVFLKAFNIPESARPVMLAVFPKVLSPDRKEIKLTPGGANSIQQGVIQYDLARSQAQAAEAQASAPPSPPEPEELPQSVPYQPPALPPQEYQQAPPSQAPVYQPTSEEEAAAPSEGPVMAPTQAPLPPEAVASGAQSWQRGISALRQFATQAPLYEQQLRTAGDLTPEAMAAVQEWLRAADTLKQHFANIIEGSSNLQTAIDAVGQGAVAGFGYFADFASATSEALNLLRIPLTVTFQGFAEVATLPWLEQLQIPQWQQLMGTLSSGAVATVGATELATKGEVPSLDADSEAFAESNRKLAELITSGRLSASATETPSTAVGGKSSGVGLLIGAVAVGVVGVFLFKRKRPK